jgi:hypothetical protein
VFGKYVVFKVTTKPLNFEVERRYSDFLWLRNHLAREFPGLYIPPMAPKDGKHFDEDYLNKRKEMLQLFIDDILEHPTLKVTQVFLDFLKIAGEEAFNSSMTSYDNKKTMASVI